MFFRVNHNQRCFNVKLRRWFNVNKLTLFWRWNILIESWRIERLMLKDFNFSSIIYKNKIAFRVNPKSTLFQRWILSMNQRCQIDVESTWISGWTTSWRYFNIYQSWINVECLLGLFYFYSIFIFFVIFVLSFSRLYRWR